MTRFYVGQRVRSTIDEDTGIIAAFEFHASGTNCIDGQLSRPCNVIIRWDRMNAGGRTAEHTDYIEPLTDPGREVIAWSECVWKPEHLRTEA